MTLFETSYITCGICVWKICLFIETSCIAGFFFLHFFVFWLFLTSFFCNYKIFVWDLNSVNVLFFMENLSCVAVFVFISFCLLDIILPQFCHCIIFVLTSFFAITRFSFLDIILPQFCHCIIFVLTSFFCNYKIFVDIF